MQSGVQWKEIIGKNKINIINYNADSVLLEKMSKVTHEHACDNNDGENLSTNV